MRTIWILITCFVAGCLCGCQGHIRIESKPSPQPGQVTRELYEEGERLEKSIEGDMERLLEQEKKFNELHSR